MKALACFHCVSDLLYLIIRRAVCRIALALLRVGNVIVLGSFALNLIGAVWVFQTGTPPDATCPQPLHVTVFVYAIVWATSVLAMPLGLQALARQL